MINDGTYSAQKHWDKIRIKIVFLSSAELDPGFRVVNDIGARFFLADFREGVVLTSVNPLPAIKKVATCFLKQQLKFGTDLDKRLLV